MFGCFVVDAFQLGWVVVSFGYMLGLFLVGWGCLGGAG
jgi:hypothetical protein